MSLVISDPLIKEKYFNLLKDMKIPVCKNCKKLFNLGFPKSEEALSDYLICVANDLICICENAKKVKKAYTSSGDSSIDIKNYYE
jgi:hypothetical protein